MNYGTQFIGVKPDAKRPGAGFEPLPWGWYVTQITGVEELDNGDLTLTLTVFGPKEFNGRTVKFINIYCGECNKHGTPRKEKYHHEMRQRVAKLIEAVGYADLALNPKLKATHQPINKFATTEHFKSRKFLAYFGQEEYRSKGQLRVKNTLDEFAWWDAQMAPQGPDEEQPAPRKDTSSGHAPDYSDTGAADDPGPPADYAGGYSTKIDADETPF